MNFLSSRNILIVNTSYCMNFFNTQWPLLLLPFRLWPISDLEAKWLSLPWLLITEDTVLKLRQLLGNTFLRERFWYLLCLCWCYRLMQSMILTTIKENVSISFYLKTIPQCPSHVTLTTATYYYLKCLVLNLSIMQFTMRLQTHSNSTE